MSKMVNEILCLFVVDNTQRLVGMLTDGDIRRALISGVVLTETISAAMKKDFIHVKIDYLVGADASHHTLDHKPLGRIGVFGL